VVSRALEQRLQLDSLEMVADTPGENTAHPINDGKSYCPAVAAPEQSTKHKVLKQPTSGFDFLISLETSRRALQMGEFFGQKHVKFDHFANFSDIFSGKNVLPP